MKRARVALAVAVGLVLADSSVVVLALPEIYRELDVSVSEVTWVLVAFNVVLAAAALPAAMAARRLGPARVTCAGLIVFAPGQPRLRALRRDRAVARRPLRPGRRRRGRRLRSA